VAAGIGPVGHVGVEVLAAAGARVLGVDQDQVAGPSGEGVAQVVEGAPPQAIPVGAMAAAGTGAPAIIPAPDADLGLGQVLDAVDPLGGIGSVFAGSRHGEAPG
jgi:D-arabinose 1-dehydrogenase-like Zn-dependent alcohol dehydrogenase